MAGLKVWGLSSCSCFPVSGSTVQEPLLIFSDKFSALLLNPQRPPPPLWEKEAEAFKETGDPTAWFMLCFDHFIYNSSVAAECIPNVKSYAKGQKQAESLAKICGDAFRCSAWSAPIPVSMPGCTNRQQMAWSSGKERGRNNQKVRKRERKHSRLTCPRGARLSQSYTQHLAWMLLELI